MISLTKSNSIPLLKRLTVASILPSFIPSILPSFIPSILPSFIPSILPCFLLCGLFRFQIPFLLTVSFDSHEKLLSESRSLNFASANFISSSILIISSISFFGLFLSKNIIHLCTNSGRLFPFYDF
ncbi:MAG: Pseudogene of Trehalase [Methanobrevibacter sp. CfCl-M3]